MNNSFSGISSVNAERLKRLHRETKGPFTISQAVKILHLPYNKTAYLLAYLTSRGWLNRKSNGLYITVPFEASIPSEWCEDPWIVAMSLFSPGYIGGWSACEHWGLTEQIFRDIVCITSKPVRIFRR